VFFVASSAVGNLALPHLGKIVPVRHIPRLISGFFTPPLLPLALPQHARLIICADCCLQRAVKFRHREGKAARQNLVG